MRRVVIDESATIEALRDLFATASVVTGHRLVQEAENQWRIVADDHNADEGTASPPGPQPAIRDTGF